MIVRSVHDGLQLIAQPDHAHLARAIMEHCVPLGKSPRRDAILLAIAEHDNGWTEEDAFPTINPDTGQVFDFVNVPLAVRHAVWPRGVERLKATPWTAALVAQHAVTVYDRFRSDAAWAPFFASMEGMRDELVRASGEPPDALALDYPFVRLGDLISLTFCTGWTDAHGYGHWMVQCTGTRVDVGPEAFGGAVVPFSVSARVLREDRFASTAMLRDALTQARKVTLQGSVGSVRM